MCIRDSFFVRCNLKDGIGRRVDDGESRPYVFFAKLLDNFGTGCADVAQSFATNFCFERAADFSGCLLYTSRCV